MSGDLVKRVSKSLSAVERSTQTLQDGFLSVTSDKDSLTANVQLIWSQRDFTNASTATYQSHYHVHGSFQESHVSQGLFPTPWDVDMTSVSPSRKYVCTVKLNNTDSSSEGIFCIYSENKLIATFRTPKQLHGTIYTSEREGGIAWSNDETKIVYVAEKKPAQEPPSFWENVNKSKKPSSSVDGVSVSKTESSSSDDTQAIPGDKFLQEEDWGERYIGKSTSRLFLATIETGDIEEVTGIPDNLACTDATFTPDDSSLIFAGLETNAPKRLGFIGCFNRPMELYQVAIGHSEGKAASHLQLNAQDDATKQIAWTRSPRFSPDGKKLAFLATRDVASHDTCNMLCVMDWGKQTTSTVIDVVMEPSNPGDVGPSARTSFNGLYMASLPRACWNSNSKLLFFTTQVGSRLLWKYVDMESSSVHSPSYVEKDDSKFASEVLLDQSDRQCLVAVTSPVRPASVYLSSIDFASGKHINKPIAVADQGEYKEYVGDWKLVSIPTKVSDEPAASKHQPAVPDSLHDLLLPSVYSSSDYEAFVYLPSSSPKDGGYPVLLDLHGGPNGATPLIYNRMYSFFCSQGFAVVTVNYRGSTGFGLQPLESLLGKVGTQDVYDCHYALQHLLKHSDLPLDGNDVHCSGGSHGGFLVTHLIAQFPGFYKSVVTRNPVTDITTCFYSSDIPDWSIAVAGIKRFEAIAPSKEMIRSSGGLSALSAETRLAIRNKLWYHSPMSNELSQVSTPMLLGIGAKDRRVPPTQGLEMRDALKGLGVETRTLLFPDDSHPLASVAATSEMAVNWALWLLQHSK